MARAIINPLVFLIVSTEQNLSLRYTAEPRSIPKQAPKGLVNAEQPSTAGIKLMLFKAISTFLQAAPLMLRCRSPIMIHHASVYSIINWLVNNLHRSIYLL